MSDTRIDRLSNFELSKCSRIKFIKRANLVHFIALANLVNADECLIEFIHDFALFKNILRYIKSVKDKEATTSSQEADTLVTLLAYFEAKVAECRKIFMELIRVGKLNFSYEHFANKQNYVF